MAQMVLQQVLILSAMMMLGFLLGKLGKVDRKGADLLSMLLLDVFFPCNVLAAASGDFGDMPFSQVLKIIAAYLSMFILFTYLAKPIAKLMGLNEDETLVFTRSVGYPYNGFVGIPLCTAVFGTEGTVLIDEKDPISGPNLFGGDTLMRTPDQYRWADAERRPENVNAPWPVVPNSHPYNSVSHAENPRGIGLVDLVYALEEGRKPRASGEMALHSLEVMECILKSAHEHVFCEPTTTFEQPKPLDWQ